MTDFEKAKEISRDTTYVVATGKYSYTPSIVENMCLQMAAWKEQQMIEKTVKWLKENGGSYWMDDYDLPTDELVNDFKNCMQNEM